MKGSRKFKVLLGVIFVILVTFLTFGYVYVYNDGVQEDVEEDVLGMYAVTSVPYIISLPPIVVQEGELYEYYVEVVHNEVGVEGLSLEYVDGPEWLYLDDMVLRGFAPEGSSGSYKIVLRVSDGYNSSTQEDYILVESIIQDEGQ
jgi:hypothetical protein